MSAMNSIRLFSRHFTRVTDMTRAFSVSSTRNEKFGFIGLGNMGGHMANNLLSKKNEVVVFDLDQNSVDKAVQNGATAVSSPKEVANSDVNSIVTMLPASKHVQAVYKGANGLLSNVKQGTLLVDSSTIDPSVSQEMAELAQEHGARYVDAPVSGGVNAARDAILTFMVGAASEKDYKDAEKIVSMMGKNVIHAGKVGTGQAAKICNNMLLGISMIGTSEAMFLGMELGLDASMLAKILNMSSGRCWSSEIYNPVPGVVQGVPSSKEYQGGFGSALMCKDLGLAQNAARENKVGTPLGALSLKIYQQMVEAGYGEKDFSSAFLYLNEDYENSSSSSDSD